VSPLSLFRVQRVIIVFLSRTLDERQFEVCGTIFLLQLRFKSTIHRRKAIEQKYSTVLDDIYKLVYNR
jgi:hypothetical protein